MDKTINNQQIARLLRDVAAAYEILGEDFFRIRAYQNAADAVEHSTVEIKDIWDQGKLQSVSGIGSSIAQHLAELFSTGSSSHFTAVLNKLPPTVYKLLRLPGVGAKTAAKLVYGLNLTNPQTVYQKLLQAGQEGRIAALEGFGKKSEQELIEAIKRLHRNKSQAQRMLLPYARELAGKAIQYLQKCSAVERIVTLGSLRRAAATIGDIDLAIATKRGKAVIAHFTAWAQKQKVLAAGINTARLVHISGAQIDIKTQKPEAIGALLQHFTGSKEHNIALREYAQKKGWSLSEYGIKKSTVKNQKSKIIEFSTEEAFYKALGMEWIPPELRENRGEIQAALTGRLPQLVQTEEIKGDLHIHSSFNLQPSHDLGANNFGEFIQAADRLGYEYIGFSEHNPAAKLAAKKIYSFIKARNRQLEQFLQKYERNSKNKPKLRIFKLLEVDILANGTLPLDEQAMGLLDACIVSLHSGFRQNSKQITERILAGLSYPKAKILGHPTGRLLLKREGVEADWELIFKFCAQKNKAIEINAYPDRLDLPDEMVREAAKSGVKFIIGSDAHNTDALTNLQYGVAVARRGWLTKKDILNTLPVVKFEEWLMEGR